MRHTGIYKKIFSLAGSVLIKAILCFYALTIIYPIFWSIMMALKPNSQIFSDLWGLPHSLALDNFARAWTASKIGRNFLNTVYIDVITNVLILTVCIPLSYTLGRYKFKGRGLIKAIIVSGFLFPSMTALITQYLGLMRLGLTDTFTGLIILYLAVSITFSVFMLSNFFAGIPVEFEEAARIEGCGHWRTMLSIGIPMAAPGITTLTVLQVLSVWNEYQIALTVLKSPEKRTIAVGVTNMLGNVQEYTDWGAVFAASVILMSMSFLIYAVFQRQISDNVTMGGIK